MQLTVIGSGSKGNSYALKSNLNNQVLLLECGEPLREVYKAISYNRGGVVGVLLTHEHIDHAGRVKDFLNARIAVYCSYGTACAILERYKLSDAEKALIKSVPTGKPFKVGSFTVQSFDTKHDANEPTGFIIKDAGGQTLLFATDTYYIPNRFKGVNHFLIECNYEEEIAEDNLAHGYIDERYYNRLSTSHMSLKGCICFLQANMSADVRNIVLCHLSYINSDADLFKATIAQEFGVDVHIARRGVQITLAEQWLTNKESL